MTDQTTRSRATLIKLDPAGGSPVSIPFQYNPNTLKRTLQPTTVGGQQGGHSEAVRFIGAPTEVFSINVELEAFDQLPSSAQNSAALLSGVFPLLYAIETMIYPPSSQIQSATNKLNSGSLEIAPILTPPALLVLGANRVVPVAIQSLEIVEQAFDAHLNPLRAVVTLTLRVVSYSDIVSTNAVYAQYIQYQKGKEALAATGMMT